MDYENITLPSWQLENLLESSDRMRLLCEGRRRGLDFQSSWVDVILGIDLESEKPSWDDCMDILSGENPEKLVTPEEMGCSEGAVSMIIKEESKS